jgi:hypothetical protein
MVLKTLTEHDFQDAFKKWQNCAYAWKRTTSRVMVASRPKLAFDKMAAPVPEIMDTIFLTPFSLYPII